MGRAVGSGQSAVCREDGAAHGSPCSAPAAAGSTVGRTITFPHLVKGGPGGGGPRRTGHNADRRKGAGLRRTVGDAGRCARVSRPRTGRPKVSRSRLPLHHPTPPPHPPLCAGLPTPHPARPKVSRSRLPLHHPTPPPHPPLCAGLPTPHRADRRSPAPVCRCIPSGPRPLRFATLPGIDQPNQLLQPPIRHDHIIIEQHEVFAACRLEPLVDRCRKPAICGVGNDRHRHIGHVAHASQIVGRPIGRPIIDDDQLPRPPRMALERGEALPGERKLASTG